MSDEEKKEYEELKSLLYTGTISQYGKRKLIDIIDKQSKEIEHQKEKRENQKQELAILNEKQKDYNKLVNTVNSYKGQFKRQQKEIEELNKENTRQHELICNIHQKWEDKIKAKIEEIDEVLKGQLIEKIRVYFEAQKEVLQSLLEKE